MPLMKKTKKPKPKTEDDEIEVEELDEEALAEMINDTVSKQVNGAVTGALKKGAFKEMVGAAIKDAMDGLKDTLLNDVKELIPAGGSKDDKSATGGDKGGGGLPPEVKKQIDDLAKANKKLQDQVNAEQQARAAQTQKERAAEERGALTKALKASGVADDRLAGAAALLYLDMGKVKRDEDGKIKFVGKNDELVDLDEGVADWAKAGEGKSYLPPAGVKGAGERGGLPPGSGPGEPSEAQLINALGNALMGNRIDIKI